jgi:hypothetical protein
LHSLNALAAAPSKVKEFEMEAVLLIALVALMIVAAIHAARERRVPVRVPVPISRQRSTRRR